jgi:hypothetical protein
VSSLESTNDGFKHLDFKFSDSLSLSVGESDLNSFLSSSELLLSDSSVNVLYGDALAAVDINRASGVDVGEATSSDELQCLAVQELNSDDAGDELVDFVFVTRGNTSLTIVAGNNASLNFLSREDEFVMTGDVDSHGGEGLSGGVNVEFSDFVLEVVEALRKGTSEAELSLSNGERSFRAEAAEHFFFW